EDTLNRALDVRSPLQFMRETTGAVFDTLAQIHLIRGEHEEASRSVEKAKEAYGEYGAHTSRWYQWSLRVLEARLALRRGEDRAALAIANDIASSEAPAGYAVQAELIAIETLLASGACRESQERLENVARRIQPNSMSGTWGEFLRLRGRMRAASGRGTDAYHDFGQSVSVFDLLGERYQAGLSYLELGRLAASAGARSRATRYLSDAQTLFESLGAAPDLAETRAALDRVPTAGTGGYVGVQVDGDDALVRRIVDAAAMPALLAREGATALFEGCDAQAAALFVQTGPGRVDVLAAAGLDVDGAHRFAIAALRSIGSAAPPLIVESIGRDVAGPRFAAVSTVRPFTAAASQRLRMLCAVLRLGFDLCEARERPSETATTVLERQLEPLLPGFVCACAAMQRVADQIQRLQGNDLTVLITGESGTGKDLVARAIHAGSLRSGNMFLPYNCTSATRELADSQLFGHRRGSFTGAVADQPGVLRTAVGGTLFLDEVGDLPLDVQPKLLRFLEQGEVLPVGETRPLEVDVRVVAATNADLEHRVTEGRFREDLFYRLSVIRIHVPPLRERRQEIPHLSTFFLREASEKLGKPGVRLSAETLDLFDVFPWPGNVRQLRNEIQRAVALALPGGVISPELLSPPLAGAGPQEATAAPVRGRRTSLSAAVEKLERELIENALERSAGNISETARVLGLTRRGLYLKMERLGVAGARHAF
ncbi:MAG: sigma-54 interaction domain-containing protein, partial [Vicinamibacterales bacterium]